jgi:adhesin transport system outer membrane protein
MGAFMARHSGQGGGQGRRAAGALCLLATAGLMLSGCGDDGAPGVGMGAGANLADPPASVAAGEVGRAGTDRPTTGSAVIADLRARRSVLAPGVFAQVADAVLAADQGAGAAELRVARLKAQAKARNWLPQIGPSVDLASLGSLAAGMLVDQLILDNGRRKAERTFAAADVEVAAVMLATEMNARVHDGLARYVEAERAAAQVAVLARATERMQDYARIMEGRIEGGIADRAEGLAVAQKLAELRALESADRQAGLTARAELAALAGGDLAVTGLPQWRITSQATPLSVLRAEAEGRRLVAEARIDRAAQLPGLKAGASVSGDGITGGLKVSADRLLGLGTKASLQALEATEAVARQRDAEAADEAARRIVTLERQLAETEAQAAEGAGLVAEMRSSLALYTEQYKAGVRPLRELVTLTDDFARMERGQTALAYDAALIRLRIALERGVLVDGARM